MRDRPTLHESPPRHPPLTPRGLLAAAAIVVAVPATLFAIEQPVVVATSLLTVGAVATAFRRE